MKDLVRRLNFFTAAFVAVTGISLAGEIIMEDEVPDKLDDIAMLILGAIVIWWYKKIGWTEQNTRKSIIFLIVGIIIKIVAVFIEHDDKEAVGDDFGILVALILALFFVLHQSFFRKISD